MITLGPEAARHVHDHDVLRDRRARRPPGYLELHGIFAGVATSLRQSREHCLLDELAYLVGFKVRRVLTCPEFWMARGK